MAHFYAEAQGSRGATHRLGGKENGAVAGVRGWHDGVEVVASHNEAQGRNEYEIRFTGGSSPAFSGIKVGKLFIKDKQIVFQPDVRSLNGKDDIIIKI